MKDIFKFYFLSFTFSILLLWSTSLSAQRVVTSAPQVLGSLPRTDIIYPVKVEGECAPRADFFSYSTSPVAQRGAIADEFFYKPITGFESFKTDSSTIYNASVELSARWLGRSSRIHIEGSRRVHRVWINDNYLGTSTDSRLPSEFSLSTHLVENTNRIKIEVLDAEDPASTIEDNRAPLTDVYLVSQPMAHIADYDVVGKVDSLGRGHLYVNVTIENGYNLMRPISVGCVVTLPDGRTNGYVPVEKVVREHATEQIAFDIEVSNPQLWSSASPMIYPILLYVRFDGHITEYVPIKGAFKEMKEGNEVADIAVFNVYASQKETIEQLKGMKASGVTCIRTDHPQPSWFYDICDTIGMEVIEGVNIHTDNTINNSPEFAVEFERRAEATYIRSHQHPCIVSYYIGRSEIGTNYAMWRAYLKLEQLIRGGTFRVGLL